MTPNPPTFYIYTRKPKGLHRCSPHQWIDPAKGDEALECQACGRYLPFTHITPVMRQSIANCDKHAASFKTAFTTWVGAQAKRRGIRGTTPGRAAGGPYWA